MATNLSKPPLIMKQEDVTSILTEIGPDTFLGRGAAGSVYRVNYYGIPAVVKIPHDEGKKASLKQEISIYGHICKVFNRCECKANIVQMLGYDNNQVIIMLEYFDGSDLVKYTGYPMSPITFGTHRLLPRSDSRAADFSTLGKYLSLSSAEDITFALTNKMYTGLQCLHNLKILHNDFQLKNVLIRSDGKIGIADFGGSRIVGGSDLPATYGLLSRFFANDFATLGPIMGDFLDSSNPEPYQYRLDKGPVNNVPILDSLSSPHVKDAFLLLTSFNQILAFISVMYYINLHTDRTSGQEIVEAAFGSTNDLILDEVPEDQQDEILLLENEIDIFLDVVYDDLITNPDLPLLIRYFRTVMQMLLNTNLDSESVYDHIKRTFGHNYAAAIQFLNEAIRYGFLLKHFDLFMRLYKE